MDGKGQRPAAWEQQVPYTRSEAVRQLLTLVALTNDNAKAHPDMHVAMRGAFDNVMEGLRTGHLVLDYLPGAGAKVEIPPVSDPHYMQALLYWCSRLQCTLPRLVEAYARLGSQPSVEAMWATLRRIEQEDAVAETALASTRMPANTRPSPFRGLLGRKKPARPAG
jgi:hypothetical protein